MQGVRVEESKDSPTLFSSLFAHCLWERKGRYVSGIYHVCYHVMGVLGEGGSYDGNFRLGKVRGPYGRGGGPTCLQCLSLSHDT